MPFRSALCLIAATLVVAAAAAQQPPEKTPRLKVRLEVSKKLANLFVLKKDKVLLKNGAELTLLRGCDVELMVADRFLAFGVPPDPKLPAGVIRLNVQLDHEFPGVLANPTDCLERHKIGRYMPSATFSYSGLGSGGFESQVNCVAPPTAADWEKVRLAGLAQLDGRMRKALGQSLVHPASLAYHEKAGWYVQNPYSFVVSGKAELVGKDKKRQPVPFRLAPGSRRQWIDADRFQVRDLVLSGK